MSFDAAQFVAERLVAAITKEMGYDLPADRISRIAEEAIKIQGQHGASLLSLAVAIDFDFLMWGDPKAPVMELKGLHTFDSVLKEIYDE